MVYLGIDVSKQKLDLALLGIDGKYRSKVFSNDAAGHVALLDWIDNHAAGGLSQVRACMESTGSYHEALANRLFDAQIHVSIVNPLLVKRFIESEGLRAKTDRIDAKALARFAKERQPVAWEAPPRGVRILQALVARLDTLLEMRQTEANRLAVAHEAVRGSHEAMLLTLDQAIEEVRQAIRKSIDDDPDLKKRQDLLETIPGLGDRTIPQLLAYIGRPERFHSASALAAYAGLIPWIRQSGTSLNQKRGLHPLGHAQLRRCLYFPAMVAGRCNPVIAAFWKRLQAQNKPGKVIVAACMHKLLAIIYAVLKSGQAFNATHRAKAGT